MKKKSLPFALLVSTMPLGLYLSLATKTKASDISVGIKPPVTDVIIEPGQTTSHEFVVTNLSKNPVVLRPLFQPFKASPRENGEVSYLEATPSFFNNLSVRADGQALGTLELKPGEEKTIELQIQAKPTERSADYYFSLIMMSEPEINQTILDANNTSANERIASYATISGGVASHVLVSVDPAIAKKLVIKEFSAPFFSQNSTVAFHARLSNENSSYSRVHGQIEIKNILGNQIKRVIIPETRILEHSTRQLKTDVEEINNDTVRNISSISESTNLSEDKPTLIIDDLFPGYYQATLTVGSARSGEAQVSTIHFFIIPFELLVLFISVILIGYLVKRRIRKKTSH